MIVAFMSQNYNENDDLQSYNNQELNFSKEQIADLDTDDSTTALTELCTKFLKKVSYHYDLSKEIKQGATNILFEVPRVFDIISSFEIIEGSCIAEDYETIKTIVGNYVVFQNEYISPDHKYDLFKRNHRTQFMYPMVSTSAYFQIAIFFKKPQPLCMFKIRVYGSLLDYETRKSIQYFDKIEISGGEFCIFGGIIKQLKFD
jgi:hypothetical protein